MAAGEDPRVVGPFKETPNQLSETLRMRREWVIKSMDLTCAFHESAALGQSFPNSFDRN
jgi:hypothetical protein